MKQGEQPPAAGRGFSGGKKIVQRIRIAADRPNAMARRLVSTVAPRSGDRIVPARMERVAPAQPLISMIIKRIIAWVFTDICSMTSLGLGSVDCII